MIEVGRDQWVKQMFEVEIDGNNGHHYITAVMYVPFSQSVVERGRKRLLRGPSSRGHSGAVQTCQIHSLLSIE